MALFHSQTQPGMIRYVKTFTVKCSKVSNTFLVSFEKKCWDSDLSESMLFGKQQVFKI